MCVWVFGGRVGGWVGGCVGGAEVPGGDSKAGHPGGPNTHLFEGRLRRALLSDQHVHFALEPRHHHEAVLGRLVQPLVHEPLVLLALLRQGGAEIFLPTATHSEGMAWRRRGADRGGEGRRGAERGAGHLRSFQRQVCLVPQPLLDLFRSGLARVCCRAPRRGLLALLGGR